VKPLIVQKNGGSSLAEPEQIRAVAARVARLRDAGSRVLVVVSAMGKTTDQLVELAYKVSATPNRRELDMLLTTGERVSMALMSMALNELGCPAISFTGSQAGVLTDELHSNARITDVRPVRVESELSRNSVVVLAGFQGVSPRTKEVTTLGRGGSDTTAVAMAAYFRAEKCEILKDVDGVHSGDPNVVTSTSHLPQLHYFALLDMTFWGSKVLHYRSVELAHLLGIQIVISLAHPPSEGGGASTLINGDTPMYEQARILSVNSHKEVRWLIVQKADLASAMQEFSGVLRESNLPLPQLLDSEKRGDSWAFLITAPSETLGALAQVTEKSNQPGNIPGFMKFDGGLYSSITATCQGSYASPLPEDIAAALQKRNVPVLKMIFGAMSITVLVNFKDREKALQIVHDVRFPQSPSAAQ
jgi:aspartate kinase